MNHKEQIKQAVGHIVSAANIGVPALLDLLGNLDRTKVHIWVDETLDALKGEEFGETAKKLALLDIDMAKVESTVDSIVGSIASEELIGLDDQNRPAFTGRVHWELEDHVILEDDEGRTRKFAKSRVVCEDRTPAYAT